MLHTPPNRPNKTARSWSANSSGKETSVFVSSRPAYHRRSLLFGTSFTLSGLSEAVIYGSVSDAKRVSISTPPHRPYVQSDQSQE